MPQTVELRGRAAAPGIASGRLAPLDRPPAARRQAAGRESERADLEKAVAAAIAALAALARTVDGEGADMLAFQIAMLEDSALAEPAFARIAGGGDAVAAWSETLAAQIADYEASDSDYFRARASDLKDIRDRVIRHLLGETQEAEAPGAVLTGEDVTPSRFLAMDWSRGGGLALFAGSPSSHVAMLARSRGVPMVVGLGRFDLDGHRVAIVDGDAGRVVLSPRAGEWAAYEASRAENARHALLAGAALHRPAATADGVAVAVMLNVADPAELAGLDPSTCDGIGLVRTEFFFHGAAGPPDEEAQYRAYRQIVEWAGGRPVVFRTLDAGGDKPIAGITIEGESNPFLGTRGIRLSLARPEIFRLQLRALARVAAAGDVKVMLPMVTVPGEIDAAAAMLDEAVAGLVAAGAACRRPPLGIMVEVPATAIAPALFAKAAFFSIGSNDLTQYVTASARDIAAVASLNDASHPAVLALIRGVVAAGRSLGRDVSLCGDMGGDPAHLPALISAGVRTVSVAPPLLGRTKLAIAGTTAAPP